MRRLRSGWSRPQDSSNTSDRCRRDEWSAEQLYHSRFRPTTERLCEFPLSAGSFSFDARRTSCRLPADPVEPV